jgi:amidohydrolase
MMETGYSRIERLRVAVRSRLREIAPDVRRLAEQIHRTPELACDEVQTVTRLSGELEEEGFEVETNLAGLHTAFRAVMSRGAGPSIAFLSEYDAIPGLGHAAGHNLIVAATYGAAVALASALEELEGTVGVYGAPAEETIGGKVVLTECGAFDGVDVAMLAHPDREDRTRVATLASWSFEVVFEGRAAHAVAAPHEGINALDAMIQLFVARDALLKALRAEVRMPGVILEGGVRPNLVPSRCRARFSLRAGDARYLHEVVVARFREMVHGVARSTGTVAHVRPIDNLYDELLTSPLLAGIWERHARELGMTPAPRSTEPVGSLDVGRLSHRIPCIHPFFRVTEDLGTASYTPAFASACRSQYALERTVRAAEALALTALDLLADPALVEKVKSEHAELAGTARREFEAPLVTEPADS